MSYSLSATALSIGRARAVTFVGKPLDFSVPLATDESEDATSLCTDVQVFFGEDRLGTSDVNTSLSRGTGREQILRVRSTVVINEPVVTVMVRAGCAQKSERRFVLLADVETELADAGSTRNLSQSAPNSAGASAGAGSSVITVRPSEAAAGFGLPSSASALVPSVVRRAPRAVTSGQAPRAARQPSAAPPRSVVRKDPASQAVTPPSARLKVDAFDPLAEFIPNLRGSGQMLSQPNEAQRAEAAALWRAINAQPADVLRDTQRLQSLETNVKTLQTQAQGTQVAVQDVRVQLEEARKQRFFNPLVYALGGLLLLTLGALAYLWTRMRRNTVAGTANDWRQAAGPDRAPTRADEIAAVRAASIVRPTGLKPGLAKLAPGVEPDEYTTDMLALPEDDDFRVEHVDASAPSGAFVSARDGGSRAADAEELFDVQQQADFFASLGQYDQAIEVLQNHISDNVETSALAYLDLLDIYVRLGRRDDYDLLRQDFNRVFNGQVPGFDDYRVDGRGLEAYAGALSRIEQLWQSSKVLGVIEESLFRKSDNQDDAFDLQAYRELLLLYSVAKENANAGEHASLDLDLGAEDSDSSTVFDSGLTLMQPLPTERSMQTTALSERDMAAFNRYSTEAGAQASSGALDIDLGDIDIPIDDADADPKGSGSAWIEFDLDELTPTAQRTLRDAKR